MIGISNGGNTNMTANHLLFLHLIYFGSLAKVGTF